MKQEEHDLIKRLSVYLRKKDADFKQGASDVDYVYVKLDELAEWFENKCVDSFPAQIRKTYDWD
jgi:hypothetical protein